MGSTGVRAKSERELRPGVHIFYPQAAFLWSALFMLGVLIVIAGGILAMAEVGLFVVVLCLGAVMIVVGRVGEKVGVPVSYYEVDTVGKRLRRLVDGNEKFAYRFEQITRFIIEDEEHIVHYSRRGEAREISDGIHCKLMVELDDSSVATNLGSAKPKNRPEHIEFANRIAELTGKPLETE